MNISMFPSGSGSRGALMNAYHDIYSSRDNGLIFIFIDQMSKEGGYTMYNACNNGYNYSLKSVHNLGL